MNFNATGFVSDFSEKFFFGALVTVYIISSLFVTGFIVWVVIKLMAHFGVI